MNPYSRASVKNEVKLSILDSTSNISTLLEIVTTANSTENADNQIISKFEHLNSKSAKFIRLDVQDFIDENMTESQLSFYLSKYSL